MQQRSVIDFGTDVDFETFDFGTDVDFVNETFEFPNLSLTTNVPQCLKVN